MPYCTSADELAGSQERLSLAGELVGKYSISRLLEWCGNGPDRGAMSETHREARLSAVCLSVRSREQVYGTPLKATTDWRICRIIQNTRQLLSNTSIHTKAPPQHPLPKHIVCPSHETSTPFSKLAVEVWEAAQFVALSTAMDHMMAWLSQPMTASQRSFSSASGMVPELPPDLGDCNFNQMRVRQAFVMHV